MITKKVLRFFTLSFFGCLSLVCAQGASVTNSGSFSLSGEIVSGQVSFSNVGNEFQITASDGAVISYENFDIPVGETLRFLQPSADASVLNRISSHTPTRIDGNLYGNGKVIITNPYGIIFSESAVLEVGKLHAIAGYESEDSYSLYGEIANHGTIEAKEVVLAGTAVTNTGTILVEDGALIMAAGSGMQLINEEGTLNVSLSSDPLLYGGASDLAGQAILQSGVIQASKVQFHGNSISHTGSTRAGSVRVAEHSNFKSIDDDSGITGRVVAGQLLVEGVSSSSSAPSFELSGKSNAIEKLTVSGTHQEIKIRSSTSMQVGDRLDSSDEVPALPVQHLDLRVDDTDLELNTLPTPNDSGSDNSLLLAAENKLVLTADVDSFGHSRKVMYGRNLTVGSIEEDGDLSLGSTVSLDAASVFIDDLSIPLSPSALLALARDNPGFAGFGRDGSEVGSSETLSEFSSQSPSVTPSSSPSGSPSSMPSYSPSQAFSQTLSGAHLASLSQLSNAQLEVLLKYGLLTGYSYFLQAPDELGKLAHDMELAGGPSAFFGGSYDLLVNAMDFSSAFPDTREGTGESILTSSNSNGVAPYAPISQPVLSVEASKILDEALSPEVEEKMQNFLTP